jgi:hypothetical protein
MAAHAGALTVGGVALAALIAGEGDMADAWRTIEVAVPVMIVLAVVGLLAALIVRIRAERQGCRQNPASGPLWVRAEVIGRPSPLPPPPSPSRPERAGGSIPAEVTAGRRPANARLALPAADPRARRYRRTPEGE